MLCKALKLKSLAGNAAAQRSLQSTSRQLALYLHVAHTMRADSDALPVSLIRPLHAGLAYGSAACVECNPRRFEHAIPKDAHLKLPDTTSRQ